MTRDLLSLTGRGKFLFLGLFTTQEALLRYRASNANAVFMCLWVSLLTFFFFFLFYFLRIFHASLNVGVSGSHFFRGFEA